MLNRRPLPSTANLPCALRSLQEGSCWKCGKYSPPPHQNSPNWICKWNQALPCCTFPDMFAFEHSPQRDVPKYLKQTDLYMPGTKTSNINTSSRVNKSSSLSSDFTSTASCVLFQSWSSFVLGFRPASAPHSLGHAWTQEEKVEVLWESRLFTHLADRCSGYAACAHVWGFEGIKKYIYIFSSYFLKQL